jgi:hypothetical protein
MFNRRETRCSICCRIGECFLKGMLVMDVSNLMPESRFLEFSWQIQKCLGDRDERALMILPHSEKSHSDRADEGIVELNRNPPITFAIDRVIPNFSDQTLRISAPDESIMLPEFRLLRRHIGCIGRW